MNLGALIALFRQEADDQASPYLWSDAEATDYANDAQNEACRRARLIVDSTTAAVCQIAVAANTPVLALDPRVLFVRRAKLASRSVPLVRRHLADMDLEAPGWEAITGSVDSYIPDWQTGALRLYRTPTATDTLNLTVVRLPLADMANLTTDSPEIHTRFHRSLRFWMLYRAFSKQDADTVDPKRATTNLAQFEAEFGAKSAAIEEEWIRAQQAYDGYDGTF